MVFLRSVIVMVLLVAGCEGGWHRGKGHPPVTMSPQVG